MSKEIKDFLSRLKTVGTKAREEDMTTMGIYARINRGRYETVEIDGIKFIVEKEDGDDV